jgi:hypothetical protein
MSKHGDKGKEPAHGSDAHKAFATNVKAVTRDYIVDPVRPHLGA